MRALLASLLLAAVFCVPARGGELVFEDVNFAVTIPESGWRDVRDEERWVAPAVAVADSGGRQFVVLVRKRYENFRKWDDESLSWLDGTLAREISVGMKYTTSEANGLPAVRFHGPARLESRNGTIFGRIVLTDECMYMIFCAKVPGEAREDAELVAMLESFRFLQPPAAPAAIHWITWVGAMIAGVVALGIFYSVKEMIRKTQKRNRHRIRPSEPVE